MICIFMKTEKQAVNKQLTLTTILTIFASISDENFVHFLRNKQMLTKLNTKRNF